MTTGKKGKQPSEQQRKPSSAGFSHFAALVARWVGSPWMFLAAVVGIVVWAALGFLVGFSDTWQLVVNTATTIVTFLVVFLIQNTQNRDSRAIHLKLDEIIRSIRRAHNEMIDIEHLSDEDLDQMSKHYERIRNEKEHRQAGKKNQSDEDERRTA